VGAVKGAPFSASRGRAEPMGFEGAAGAMGGGVRALMRRKQVDSERARPAGSSNELRKELSVAQLIAIGRDTSSCSCFFSYSSLLFSLSVVCFIFGGSLRGFCGNLERCDLCFAVSFLLGSWFFSALKPVAVL